LWCIGNAVQNTLAHTQWCLHEHMYGIALPLNNLCFCILVGKLYERMIRQNGFCNAVKTVVSMQ